VAIAPAEEAEEDSVVVVSDVDHPKMTIMAVKR
jgi:hypothetical protein